MRLKKYSSVFYSFIGKLCLIQIVTDLNRLVVLINKQNIVCRDEKSHEIEYLSNLPYK